MSNVRAHARIRRSRWSNLSPMVYSAFNTIQLQGTSMSVRPPANAAIKIQDARVSSPNSVNAPWSVNERRFALSSQSVRGLRFARLNSQGVVVLRMHRPSRSASSVRHQRVAHCGRQPRFACFHSILVRRRLQAAFLPPALAVPFGHQRPNPSVEGMAKRLRLLSTPHLKR
jgi:hypothetical protein